MALLLIVLVGLLSIYFGVGYYLRNREPKEIKYESVRTSVGKIIDSIASQHGDWISTGHHRLRHKSGFEYSFAFGQFENPLIPLNSVEQSAVEYARLAHVARSVNPPPPKCCICGFMGTCLCADRYKPSSCCPCGPVTATVSVSPTVACRPANWTTYTSSSTKSSYHPKPKKRKR